jgi:uncharacterized protein (DUF58 family)
MLKLDIDPKPRIQILDVTTRGLVASNFMGDYQSIFKGKGISFESYREYTTTDDAELIDWKASLRAGKTLVREFVEERNLEVFFLIDASYSMVFGSQVKLKHEYVAEMVAAMSFAILERGDSVGVGLFSDKVHGFLTPYHGIVQYRRILRELTNPAHYDGPCNIEEAIKVCINRLRPQTIIILITDAVGLQGSWEHPIKIANQKFEVLAILVRDPRDDELPEGAGHIVVENAYTGEQIIMDSEKIRVQYAHAASEIKERAIATLKRARVGDIAVISSKEDFAKHIIAFFERRKRRWR